MQNEFTVEPDVYASEMFWRTGEGRMTTSPGMMDYYNAQRTTIPVVQNEYLSVGDYAGAALIGAANIEAWKADFKQWEEEWWQMTFGSHGYRAILVRLEDGTPDEIKEALQKLHDGCILLDEDKLAELEMAVIDAAWPDTKKDLIQEIKRAVRLFMDDEELDDSLEEKIESLDDETLHELIDRSKVQWLNESGETMWLDTRKVAQHFDVLSFLGDDK